MSLEEYAFNLLLVAVVIRQLRGRHLTPLGLLWPLGLVLWAAVSYLHGIPTAGNDLPLTVVGAAAGAVLGVACAVLTRVFADGDGRIMAKATGLAALLWVVGVGSRLAFALYGEHGGGPSIARFSAAHAITSTAAWTACLILMSLSEVVGRTAVLGLRAVHVKRSLSAASAAS